MTFRKRTCTQNYLLGLIHPESLHNSSTNMLLCIQYAITERAKMDENVNVHSGSKNASDFVIFIQLCKDDRTHYLEMTKKRNYNIKFIQSEMSGQIQLAQSPSSDTRQQEKLSVNCSFSTGYTLTHWEEQSKPACRDRSVSHCS